MKMEKQPTSKTTVRFQDCDPLGHLNNSKYIDYMINAREDHLKTHYGLDIYGKMQKDGTAWVVGKNEILYKAPANLMEEVCIMSQVVGFGPRFITVEIAMFDRNMMQLKAIMRSTFIPFDIKTQTASKHTSDIMELLEQVRVDAGSSDLEQRVEEIVEQIVAPADV